MAELLLSVYVAVAVIKFLFLCLWFSNRTVLGETDYPALMVVSLAWPLVLPMYLIGLIVYGGSND